MPRPCAIRAIGSIEAVRVIGNSRHDVGLVRSDK